MMPKHTDVKTFVPTIYGDFLETFGASWTQQIQSLQQQFGVSIVSIAMPGTAAVDIPTVLVKASAVHSILFYLKDHFGYQFLTDMTAVDETPADPRFLLVFHLFNLETKARIRIKAAVAENETIATFISIWPGANWAEREIFDMFGIRFEGHPDLRRILMDIRFEGHPLRKDYPLRGYQVFLTPEPIDPELLK
jgi:NADH-quinone oxidoreductase subunit C